MKYEQRYNLEKGIKWILHRKKQEKYLIRKSKRDKIGMALCLIRISILEDVLNEFIKGDEK